MHRAVHAFGVVTTGLLLALATAATAQQGTRPTIGDRLKGSCQELKPEVLADKHVDGS